MEEVVLRRFESGQNLSHFASLFVLDGGKGQLQTIKRCLERHTELPSEVATVQFVSL